MNKALSTEKLVRVAAALALAFVASVQVACSKSAWDPTMATATPALKGDDNAVSGATSTMTVSADEWADGQSAVIVTLYLRNYKSVPLAGITMNLTSSGTGNVIVPCTASDSSGLSRCKIMSTVAEVKNLNATGDTVLTGTTHFLAVIAGASAFQIVSSSGSAEVTAGGTRLVATTGVTESDVAVRDTLGRVIVMSSILGSVLSE